MTTRNNYIPGLFRASSGHSGSRTEPKSRFPETELARLDRAIGEKQLELLKLLKQDKGTDAETRKSALKRATAEFLELQKVRRQLAIVERWCSGNRSKGRTVEAAETEPPPASETEPPPASEIIEGVDRAMEAILKQRQNQRFFEKAGIKKAEDILALEDNDYRDMLTAKAQSGLLDPRIDIFGED